MRRALTFFVAIIMCFSLSSCGEKTQESINNNTMSSGESPQSVEEENGPLKEPVKNEKIDEKQYFNTFMAADATTLDISLRSDAYSSSIITNTMDGLLRREGIDGDHTIAPAEAESWEVNDAGDVWTFHLRDGIQWWDGVPVTAEQYVYSLQRSADPKTGCPNSFFLAAIKNFKSVNTGKLPVEELGVKALDDKTLEITLEAPTPSFLQMVCSSMYCPQRKDKIEEWGEKFGTEAKYYVGNGPFKLDKWVRNSSFELIKNDTYWDKNSVKLQNIHCAISNEPTTYLHAFQSGELDYTSTRAPEWMTLFDEQGAIHEQILSPYLFLMPINNRDPLFSNLNIRKAFGLVMDREELSEMCWNSQRLPCYGVIVPALTVGEESFRKIAGDPIKEMRNALISEGKSAKDLLLQGMEELGLGSDPSTLTITLSLSGTSEGHKSVGEYLQQVYAEELGVKCEIEMMEYGIYADKIKRGDFQLGFQGWGAYYSDPHNIFGLFDSSYDAFGTGWCSEEYNRLLEESAHEMNEQKRTEMYLKLEKMLIEENFVVIPLAYGVSQDFYQPYMRGYDTTTFGGSGFKYMYTSGRP